MKYVIHDDASTDSTQSINKECVYKYFDVINPILQSENQYSQGIYPYVDFLLPRVKGKYIAICEGDDCWTDSMKLQLQIDFLENNESFSVCIHQTKQINMIDMSTKNVSDFNNDCEVDIENIFKWRAVCKLSSLCTVANISPWMKFIFKIPKILRTGHC